MYCLLEAISFLFCKTIQWALTFLSNHIFDCYKFNNVSYIFWMLMTTIQNFFKTFSLCCQKGMKIISKQKLSQTNLQSFACQCYHYFYQISQSSYFTLLVFYFHPVTICTLLTIILIVVLVNSSLYDLQLLQQNSCL